MTDSINVPVMYLDSTLQVLEQLLHEVDDDAAPVDAQAIIEETQMYLKLSQTEQELGTEDARKEEKPVDPVEEKSTEEPVPA